MSDYDSRPETYEHINNVQEYMLRAISSLQKRALDHDQSKLKEPELSVFNKYTPKLKDSEYGSSEYREYLKGMKLGLDHHYENNSHHPEYYGDEGINGMTLLDIVEMLCDWKAATKRHDTGDIRKSVEINQERFGFSDELKQIFLNTISELEMDD